MTTPQPRPPAPLAGLLVLDLSTLLPGPLAGLMLARAGARVLKIERPGGEEMRRFPPRHATGSASHDLLNAGKEIVEIDLKAPSGRERLLELVERADILIEQFRPGVMERLGLGAATLLDRNPRLIVCSITGYGQDGPRAAQAGHDLNYQALAGLLGPAAGDPPALVADIAGGSFSAVINILLALRQRDATGHGQHLDIAMTDALFTFSWMAFAERANGQAPTAAGQGLLTGGSPRYRIYATRDKQGLAVAALEAKFWDSFCDAIDLPGPLRDDRPEPQATLMAVARLVARQDAAHWREVFAARDCCVTVVRDVEMALSDPHFAARLEGAGGAEGGLPLPLAPALRA